MTRAIVGAVLALSRCSGAYGQVVDAQARFEVASVKPAPQHKDQDVPPRFYGDPGTNDPGQIICDSCPLPSIINIDYC